MLIEFGPSIETTGTEAMNIWFLNTLVKIRVPHTTGPDAIAIMEHLAPFGDSPPMHVHRNQDEGFIVLDGELRVVENGRERQVKAGDAFLAAKGLPHTYGVLSPAGSRFMTITRGPDFEGLVRALGRPAQRDGLPPPGSLQQLSKLQDWWRLAENSG